MASPDTRLDRTTPPPVREIEKMDLLRAREHRLDNGIPCYEVHGGSEDVVRVEFLFRAGSYFQPKPLIAAAVNQMLTEGTTSMSAREIAEKIEYYGVVFNTGNGKDYAYVEVYTLNEHLPDILPLMREVLTAPVFPEEELEHYRDREKHEFEENSGKVNFLARQRFIDVIFGEHPYGQVVREASDFDRLKRGDLVDFFGEYYDLSRCDIIISGKTSRKTIDVLNDTFGDLEKKEGMKKDAPLPDLLPDPEQRHFVEKKDALQAAIRIGRPLFNKTHEDHARMLVLNTILGGYFGSRLNSNIREDKGYTYGIGSGAISLRHSGYFFITTEVGADVKDAALEEIYKEVARLRDEQVGEEELSLVRNYMAGMFLRSADGPFSMAEMFKGIHKFGLGYGHYDELLDTINHVTPRQLQETAQKYWQEEDLFEVVAGRKD